MFHDDGGQLVVVQCETTPPRVARFEDGQAALEVLERLASGGLNGPTPAQREVMGRLLDVGALLRQELAPRDTTVPGGQRIFALDSLRIELGPLRDAGVMASRLQRFLRREVRAVPRHCRAIQLCPAPVEHHRELKGVLALARDMLAFLEAEALDPSTVHWALMSPHVLPIDSVRETLDALEHASWTFVDRSEFPGQRGVGQQQLDFVAALAAEGFGVRVLRRTRFPADLPDQLTQWSEHNESCGVSVLPMALDAYDGLEARPLIGDEDYGVALEVMEELTARLQPILHVSDPWRSALLTALVPGPARREWDPRRSCVYLHPNGNWSRSRLHAEHGLRGRGRSPFSRVRRSGAPGEPDCSICGFAPACHRYWSTDWDVLKETGRRDRATELAHYQCRLNVKILERVLREWDQQSQEIEAAASPRPLHAQFEGGILRFVEPAPSETER